MPKGVIPLVVIAAFVAQFFVQRNVLTPYDYQCGRYGATFSPTAFRWPWRAMSAAKEAFR